MKDKITLLVEASKKGKRVTERKQGKADCRLMNRTEWSEILRVKQSTFGKRAIKIWILT